jgi:nucleoside-diphosphate-sugar epimerase
MKILVTGGAGYVGSLLVPALLNEGHAVRVLDLFLFDPGIFDNITDSRLELITGDIRDDALLKTALKDTDAVIHLAAMSNDPSAELNPSLTRHINYDAACNLATLAKRLGVRLFINASSASVYGILKEGMANEEAPLDPITIYAVCKKESEAFILDLNDNNFCAVSLRPATLSGYAPRLRLDLTVNILTYQAIYRDKITVFGGDQYRPNLSVKDMVRAYINLLGQDTAIIGGKSYNVSQDNYTVKEVALCIKQVLDLPGLGIDTIPSDDKRSYTLDAGRISRELGFHPLYDISDSILELASKFRNKTIAEPAGSKYRNVEFLKQHAMVTAI